MTDHTCLTFECVKSHNPLAEVQAILARMRQKADEAERILQLIREAEDVPAPKRPWYRWGR